MLYFKANLSFALSYFTGVTIIPSTICVEILILQYFGVILTQTLIIL